MNNIALEIITSVGDNSGNIQLGHFHSFVVDINDTILSVSKTTTIKKRYHPKFTLPITFDRKAAELIRISQLLNHLDVIKALPFDPQNKENTPMVTYQLGDNVRCKS